MLANVMYRVGRRRKLQRAAIRVYGVEIIRGWRQLRSFSSSIGRVRAVPERSGRHGGEHGP